MNVLFGMVCMPFGQAQTLLFVMLLPSEAADVRSVSVD